MIEALEVENPQGSLLSLVLDDSVDGLLLDEIQGINPVKATLVSSGFAQIPGAQYQSSRRDERNITLHVTLEPDYATETVESLRERLHEYFMPELDIKLKFNSIGKPPIHIVGVVESFEDDYFSSDPAVDISIMCFNPDFYDPVQVNWSGNTTDLDTEESLIYTGTLETGIDFVLYPDRDLSAFTIYHRNPAGVLRQLDFNAPLLDGDLLRISTVTGAKYALLVHEGVDSSVLYGITPQSAWIELSRGENHIRVYAEGAPIPFDIYYTRKYGAV